MNNALVYQGSNGQPLTNSILVAKKFGKSHDNVLKSIRSILNGGVLKNNETPMFDESTYVNEQNGQTYPMFIMNRDGFTLLAMGFTGNKAMEFKIDYIGAFNKMEEQIKRTTMTALPNFSNPAEAARAWAAEYEQKMLEAKRADAAEQQVYALSQEIEAMQPKVSYYDTILASKETVTTTQVAQDYGMSAIAFNRQLSNMRIQHKVNGQWILYAPYISQGYVHSKQVDIVRSDGRHDTKMNTEWTQKGRLFLYETLKKSNIIPLIEQ